MEKKQEMNPMAGLWCSSERQHVPPTAENFWSDEAISRKTKWSGCPFVREI